MGFAGAIWGSRLAGPYLMKTTWGSELLNKNKNLTLQINEDSETIKVAKDVAPSVVSIVISKELDNYYNATGPFDFFFDNFFNGNNRMIDPNEPKVKQTIGGGTGFIISSDGLILTNRHVVADDGATYTVILSDGSEHEATVLGRDSLNDIAVIKIDADNLPEVELGDSDNLEIGQTVLAIGNALAEYSNTVTKGVISGINREVTAGDGRGQSELIKEAIQTDAAINPGNSGGPLLNLYGQVIGINTAIDSQGQSVGFSIPINAVKSVIESVRQYGRIVRPWLGVRYVQLDQAISKANSLNYDYGALIAPGQNTADLAVAPGSPADKAGLVENDIILELNGQKLDADHVLAIELSKYSPSDRITLKIFHKGEEKDVKIQLEERKE